MDETMNLNGMGIGTTEQKVTEVTVETPVTMTTENQDVKPNIPESSDVPQAVPENKEIINETNEEEKSLEAKNEVDFGDLDMIKELRAEEAERRKKESIFSSMDFGGLKKYLEDDDVTDISYSNGGQLWLKTLSKGVYRVQQDDINDALIEKIAFQCSNVMGKTFNMAHPFLDSESAELRMNFIHDSIARNGIAVVFRKTPAKIRLEKEKLMKENYVSLSIHDFLIKAVQGHCNIIMCGETGSGKTEFLKYLASHTFDNEKIVTVEDTLELHLDRIYPHRDIVAMKTNNVASYSDVLVTCMRQNPIWILLSEVRSAEAVTAVRNSISSGHFILSTIHADKAANIPYRLYSLLESNIDVEQFLNTIYRYIQLGVYLRGRFDSKQGRFVREIGEVTEFYVNDNNECVSNTIYQKTIKGDVKYKPISEHLLDYLEGQGIDMSTIRDANGDLEKAQAYSDENSEEKEVKNDEKVEASEEPSQIEEKVVPITIEQPINNVAENKEVTPITAEVKPITPVVEEKVVPITMEQPINKVAENKEVTPITAEVKPITPVVEEKVVPITMEQPINNNQISENKEVTPITAEIKPIAPVVEEKTVPITVDQPSPMINIAPVVDQPPKTDTTLTPSPILNGNTVDEVKPITPITTDGNNDTSSQPVNFTPINVTNIQ